MASALSASSCTSVAFSFNRFLNDPKKRHLSLQFFRIAASLDDPDCNTEECAPDKEVGKVSMEWLAGEKTKVAGTYPPRTRGWTGYVEKDTAGQTNIYSIEPTVYVAESAISSGNAGASADGSENTAAIAAGIGLICVAVASLILLQVSKNPPQMQVVEYSGASLSYYINKFKPAEIVEASAPEEMFPASPLESESSSPEVPQVSASPLESKSSSPEVAQVSIQPESLQESSQSSDDVSSD